MKHSLKTIFVSILRIISTSFSAKSNRKKDNQLILKGQSKTITVAPDSVNLFGCDKLTVTQSAAFDENTNSYYIRIMISHPDTRKLFFGLNFNANNVYHALNLFEHYDILVYDSICNNISFDWFIKKGFAKL